MSKRFNYHFQPLFFKDPTEKIPADEETKIAVMQNPNCSSLYTVLCYYNKNDMHWYEICGAKALPLNPGNMIAWADFDPQDLLIMKGR